MKVCIFLLLFCASKVYCEKNCQDYTTCSECIHAYLDYPNGTVTCKWCSSDDPNRRNRCFLSTSTIEGMKCKSEDIENPQSKVLPPHQNLDFSSDGRIIQIKPQSYKVQLRPGQEKSFTFSFKPARDYPADLYFLFDISKSMTVMRNTTADSIESIYNTMKTYTNDVYLGMGTFIDKNTPPFVKKTSDLVNSFEHRLNLIGNFSKFREELIKIHGSENQDGPEGGYDALAQVIACDKEIGWRSVSRRIVFFFTDERPHSVGDGRLAGISKPYDGKCYTENGTYKNELEMDYPSIATINEIATKEKVTVIFIVHKNVKDTYELIKRDLKGSELVWYTVSGNVVKFNEHALMENILKDEYEKISSTLKLKIDTKIGDLQSLDIKFTPDCMNAINNPQCTVNLGKIVHFTGTIKLSKYIGHDNLKVDISFYGIKNEKLTLDIDILDCGCQKSAVFNSDQCSGNGTAVCGICECNSDRTGNKCECETSASSNKTQDEKCRSEDGRLCNDFGTCNCGICTCYPGRHGNLCECSYNDCYKNCYGHGECFCGKCTCLDKWTGEACECEKECKKVDGKECNNRGECKCGQCKCNTPAKWDARRSQDHETCVVKNCTRCHQNQCNRLTECVVCRQTEEENVCVDHCAGIIVEVTEDYANATHGGEICENVQARVGCYTKFRYRYDDFEYKIYVWAQNASEYNCLKNNILWGSGVLLTVLVIGLLTLVGWKLLTAQRDKREYRRFLEMHAAEQAAINQNPVYLAPSTTFKNPAFRRPSIR